MQKNKKTLYLRCFPTNDQKKIFSHWIDACKFIYHSAMEHRMTMHEQYKKGIALEEHEDSIYALRSNPPDILEWIKSIPIESMEETLKHSESDFLRLLNDEKETGIILKARHYKDNCGYVFLPDRNRLIITRISEKQSMVKGILRGGEEILVENRSPVEGRIESVAIIKHYDNWLIRLSCHVKTETKAA